MSGTPVGGGYLVDTSVWHRSGHASVAQRLEGLRGRLYTCTVVLLEAGVSARNPEDHDDWMSLLRHGAAWLPMTPQIEQSALTAQRALAVKGYHRAAKIADLFIAAVASANGLTVLHYDSDFDLIGEVTGWATEWVAPRATL